MIRTNWCGQVAAPNERLKSARLLNSSPSPSGPPITKAAAARPEFAPGAKLAGDRRTVEVFAVRIEHDRDGALGNHIRDRDRLLHQAAADLLCAAVLDFDDLDLVEADPAPRFLEAFQIAGRKLALRPILETTDGGETKPHLTLPAR